MHARIICIIFYIIYLYKYNITRIRYKFVIMLNTRLFIKICEVMILIENSLHLTPRINALVSMDSFFSIFLFSRQFLHTILVSFIMFLVVFSLENTHLKKNLHRHSLKLLKTHIAINALQMHYLYYRILYLRTLCLSF